MAPLPEQIHGQRVTLRRPVPADAAAIFRAYAQDAQVCRYLLWRPHASEAVSRDWIAFCIEAWKAGAPLPYVIAEPGSTSAIGMIEARLQGTTVDLGYVLARTHWGKGLMREAIHVLAETALAQPQFFRVQATCDTENVQSQRALEKAGFKREGRLERWLVPINIATEPRPSFMYARVR
jgi:ribosomal-protein-alanine N-acetyltransferase